VVEVGDAQVSELPRDIDPATLGTMIQAPVIQPRGRGSRVGTLGRLKLNCRYGYPVLAATALPYPPCPVDLAIQALALPPLTKVHIMHLG
jgi:hypothetical protein